MRYSTAQPDLFATFDSPDAHSQPPPKRKAGGRIRPKEKFNESRMSDGEATASLVRGTLIARLDKLMLGPVREMCEERYGVVDGLYLSLMNDVCEALFPEEFADGCHDYDHEAHEQFREDYRRKGLIPLGGIERISMRQLATFAATLQGLNPAE